MDYMENMVHNLVYILCHCNKQVYVYDATSKAKCQSCDNPSIISLWWRQYTL